MRIILIIAYFLFTTPAIAGWGAGLDRFKIEEEDEIGIVNFDGFAFALSHHFDITSNLFVVTDYRMGQGKDELMMSAPDGAHLTLELIDYIDLSLKLQYESSMGLYLFAMPTVVFKDVMVTRRFEYTKIAYRVNFLEAGYGGGIGYKFGNSASIELKFQIVKNIEISSIGFRIKF